MRILGIDPGSRHTGYGLVERRGSRLTALVHGRLSTTSENLLARRLAVLVQGLREIVELHRPEVAVLETPFHGINPRTLIVLAQARGALLATLAGCGLEIAEYTPAEIKSAVTGNGRAEKEQVARMVALMLDLRGEKISADASDALAAAICYAHRARLDGLSQGSRKRPRGPGGPR